MFIIGCVFLLTGVGLIQYVSRNALKGLSPEQTAVAISRSTSMVGIAVMFVAMLIVFVMSLFFHAIPIQYSVTMFFVAVSVSTTLSYWSQMNKFKRVGLPDGYCKKMRQVYIAMEIVFFVSFMMQGYALWSGF
jgi:hypothetical protein